MGKVLDLENALPAIKTWALGLFAKTTDIPQKTSTTPLMNGTAAIGNETAYAAGNHVHPTDTSRAPLASPTFTGTPAAPTAAAGTNTTQIATTAFVKAAVDAVPVAADFTAPSERDDGTHGLVPAPAMNTMKNLLTASGFKELSITNNNGVELITASSFASSNSKIAYKLSHAATSNVYGVTTLSSVTNSSSETLAATPKAVKDALDAAKAYTDTQVGAIDVSGVYRYVGSVATYNDLPHQSENGYGNWVWVGTEPEVGDVYNVVAAYNDYPPGTNYAWTGSDWDALGGAFSITYATATEVTNVLNAS